MALVAVRLQAGETEEAFSALTEALRIASDTKWQIFGGVSAVKQAMQLICLLSAGQGARTSWGQGPTGALCHGCGGVPDGTWGGR